MTSIKKALNDCTFNPRIPGPMKVLADMNNPEYCVLKTIELLNQSHENITQCIQLLILAKVQKTP